MRKSRANLEIGPTITETIASFVGRYVDCVTVVGVDLGESFDQVDGVAFIAPQLRPNRMSIVAGRFQVEF